ncbi:MAG: GGDEF domain-containing protein [Gammaproteobacteria bacterium]|nr:MAG: GGDEF domain-containing protein [Gammaproteobacteria bacterium]
MVGLRALSGLAGAWGRAWRRVLGERLESFGGRMILGMLAVHAALLPLLFGGVIYIVQRGYEAQFVDHVRSQAYTLSLALASSLGRPEAQTLLEELSLSGRVLYAELVDRRNGRVVAATPGPPAPHPFREDFFFGQGGDQAYHIALPLPSRDGRMLELHLGFDEAPTRAQIGLAYRRALYIALAYVVLTLVLVALVSAQVTRSLDRVRQASRAIASGRFEQSLDLRSHVREVDSLAKDLEDMRRTLVDLAAALEYQALHDPLTGLSNRAHFYDHLHQAIAASRRTGEPFALLLVDLDRFKEINDTHGHQVGDLLLQQVAARVRHVIRESDLAARLGGDEFALLLLGADKEGGLRIARKVLEQLDAPFLIRGLELRVGASLGLAVYPHHGSDEEALIRCADISMYEAKSTGRGIQVCRMCVLPEADLSSAALMGGDGAGAGGEPRAGAPGEGPGGRREAAGSACETPP